MASTTETHECAGYLMLREKDKWTDESILRAACHGEAVWEIEGKHYCLMHAPTKDKAVEFNKVLEEKLTANDYNFRGVWFPGDVNFGEHNFKGEANFSFAMFGGYADFSQAQFSGRYANFSQAQFSGRYANFSQAQFSGIADFSEAQFSGGYVDFVEAQFSGGEADFSQAQFSGGDAWFSETQFSGGHADFIAAQFSGGYAGFFNAQFSGGNAGFSQAQFSGSADFSAAQFSGGDADFRQAQFSGELADFEAARFGHFARFSDAKFDNDKTDFREAKFGSGETGGAYFEGAEFRKGPVNFRGSQFAGTDARFDHVKFIGGDANFRRTVFEKVARFDHAVFVRRLSFSNAVFRSSAIFDEIELRSGAVVESRLARFTDFTRFSNLRIDSGVEFYFGETTFEKPEHVHFLSIDGLQPRWFIKTDVRKFIFDDVTFPRLKKRNAFEDELDRASKLMIDIARHAQYLNRPKDMDAPKSPPYKLLITAYHRLAANAEENNRYHHASSFRKLAFETERAERAASRGEWYERLNDPQVTGISLRSFGRDSWRSASRLRELAADYPWGVLQFFYRWLSGYSENWAWAFFCLFLIWPVFALAYKTAFGAQMTWAHSFGYSLLVMLLQRPEPKAEGLTQLLIGLQIILTTAQAALLVLAIRRKFMR